MVNLDYCSKTTLYQYIDLLKKPFGICYNSYPLNFVDICKSRTNISIGTVNFQTKGLRCLAYPYQGAILLNSNRNETEQSFDCCHEYIHVVSHKKYNSFKFECFETVKQFQNPILEWQSNEGAAEFLVPYKIFIPLLCDLLSDCYSASEYKNLKLNLAKVFNVPERVIHVRIESLTYEIHQYQSGIPLDRIVLKSKRQLDRERINLTSFNTLFDFYEHIDL